MKECLLCGEKVDEHAIRCSKGHSLFKPPPAGTIGRNLRYNYEEEGRKIRQEAERKIREIEERQQLLEEVKRKQREEAERKQEVEKMLRQSSDHYTEDEINDLVGEISRIYEKTRAPITKEAVDTTAKNLKQREEAKRKQRKEAERKWREETEHMQRVYMEIGPSYHNQRRLPGTSTELDERRGNQIGIAELDAYRAAQFLLEHLKNANLQKRGETVSTASDFEFNSNQNFWREVLGGQRLALRWVELIDFKIVDWFPRTPGLFHTHEAQRARSYAEAYIVEEHGIRFYEPQGKAHMIEGGIGSIRFKPLKIDSEDCWLCTATSDRYCHSGIPLAIPNVIMQKVDTKFNCKVTGQVKFLPEFLSKDYFYHMSRIPQIYVFVDAIELLSKEKLASPVNITPMVFFKGDFKELSRNPGRRREQVGNVTYVTCRVDNLIELDKAADWLEWYAERYGGEVITNFDEQRPTFRDAPFSLQNVMNGNLDIYRMHEFRIEHADIVCDTVNNIHSEKTTMTQIDVQLGNGVTIHGDFVVANSIKDSFNKVSSSSAPNDLKNLLKELATAVGKMTEQLPKETAQQVARDLDTLIAEATSPAPRKQWWQLSVDGLKKAAQDIGEIGKPVIELAGLLVPLLLSKSA